MSDEKERFESLERAAKYLKKFKRSLDLVRCAGGAGVELGLLHGDTKTQHKIIAAVKQILEGASALDSAISAALEGCRKEKAKDEQEPTR
jgi:hypothetical protein